MQIMKAFIFSSSCCLLSRKPICSSQNPLVITSPVNVRLSGLETSVMPIKFHRQKLEIYALRDTSHYAVIGWEGKASASSDGKVMGTLVKLGANCSYKVTASLKKKWVFSSEEMYRSWNMRRWCTVHFIAIVGTRILNLIIVLLNFWCPMWSPPGVAV